MSFAPFFERVKRDPDADVTDLIVYLTDGFGNFPSAAPEQMVLWVVTSGRAHGVWQALLT